MRQIQRLCTVLFGKLLAVVAAHQGRVQVAGGWHAQGALQQDLARRVVGQVFAAHHVRDALVCIVHHHGQLVGPQAIGAAQHKVAHLTGHVLVLRAPSPVLPGQCTVCFKMNSINANCSMRYRLFWLEVCSIEAP